MDTRIFKALSDQTRLELVRILLKGERCACELPEMVKKAQPTVSLQLKKLRAARILSCRKEGRKCIYRVSDPKVKRMLELI
ncbi:winged helix-turn-helix transcriptional regulator [Candidatus Micrarchaeota archaeon]|nr:winged helix-turn-helix transcriptional regulator [Candidatus Micrarchaeota archaeon]